MVDTMVDRLLFQEWTANVLKKHMDLPLAMGWAPISGGYRQLLRRFPGKALMADKSSWDWTAQSWVFEALLAVLFELGPDNDCWRRVARGRFRALFYEAVMQFSDGTLIQQDYTGVMKSGCFLTLAGNSVAQLLLTSLAKLRLGWSDSGEFWALGDDTIEDVVPDVERYVKELQSCGCVIKEYSVSDVLEFVGFVFHRDSIPTPSYVDKHVFQIEHIDDAVYEETLQQYLLLHLNSPLKPYLDRLAEREPAGTFMSDQKLKRIWLG
ncbi:hypothetical protein 2 [Hubei sobemo-like virus 14]|uniref:hypothetical protein 2 n=1 Tax=Hubei sobemo-like virus 14 TaxID=1923199 RepID=UPI00090BEE07|nr:hypothetical protein 2 [Hubei sobemo-like virus 14]APG75802.1 hypothetical protein 2 [Hubei sobemo-like virus 14]